MYPTISDLLSDLFGFHLPLPIQSFGFMLAISFLLAAWTLSLELRRKENMGIFKPVTSKRLVGKPASTLDLLISSLIGFVIGYKLIYAVLNYSDFVNDTQGILLSSEGSWIGGLMGGALAAWMKYREKEQQKLAQPRWETEMIRPYQLVGNITMVAAIGGLLGAKIFHNLENLDEFAADPLGSLISFSGLTMYGGLIVGGASVIWYGIKNGLKPFHLMDSAAPGLMLAYGSGRVGCHISGDGDWGIVNYLNKPDWLGWLPDWAWAYRYPHNVLSEGIPIEGCVGKHCMILPEPVFPTPLYEAVACMGLFIVLWTLRKKISIPGMLFSVYLIMNGVERFLIEKIRVNTKYHIGSYDITQAEIISVVLIVLGIAGIILMRRLHEAKRPSA